MDVWMDRRMDRRMDIHDALGPVCSSYPWFISSAFDDAKRCAIATSHSLRIIPFESKTGRALYSEVLSR